MGNLISALTDRKQSAECTVTSVLAGVSGGKGSQVRVPRGSGEASSSCAVEELPATSSWARWKSPGSASLTHSSAAAVDRWEIKDWMCNWQGGPGAEGAKADVRLGCGQREPSGCSPKPPLFPYTLAPREG